MGSLSDFDETWQRRERRIVRYCARQMDQAEADAFSEEILGNPSLAADVESVMWLRYVLAELDGDGEQISS